MASAPETGEKGSSAWAGAEELELQKLGQKFDTTAGVLYHRDLSSHQRALP